MANAKTGPNIYVDTASDQLTTDRTKVAYIMFTPSAANDQIVLRSSSSSSNILVIQSAVAKETKVIDLSRRPMVFPNGIYVQTLSSGASATIVTTQGNEV